MPAALAFAARLLPLLAVVAAVALAVYAHSQHRAAADARRLADTALAELLTARQQLAEVQAHGLAIQAKALEATATARRARNAAEAALAAKASRPVAVTCEGAIAELSSALEGK